MNFSSPDYQRALTRLLRSESTPKLGLERTQTLLQALGNPQDHFKTIHIAGTNGKGSTCAFLASLLRQNFDRVGMYTSPHLLCARERILFNNDLIDEQLFCEAEHAVFEAAARINEQPTFFERVTAMAFWAFAQKKVDIAVIEVGLGGRLDATNVIHPVASVITRIDLDHCEFLGDTIESIAFEKAGIIKQRVPVITGWQDERALFVLQKLALDRECDLIDVKEPCQAELSLNGDHQTHNAALAMNAVKAAGISLTQAEIQQALAKTFWPGRLELIQTDPPILIDGAHNPAGIRALVRYLEKRSEPLNLVMGTTLGHDANAMVNELMPLRDRLVQCVATRSRSPRAEAPELLSQALSRLAPCFVSADLRSAIKNVESKQMNPSALTIVTGSLYVAGEARGLFIDMPTDPELPNF
jgi:dihydrofolate synthase/folylpolyglutamate synthase